MLHEGQKDRSFHSSLFPGGSRRAAEFMYGKNFLPDFDRLRGVSLQAVALGTQSKSQQSELAGKEPVKRFEIRTKQQITVKGNEKDSPEEQLTVAGIDRGQVVLYRESDDPKERIVKVAPIEEYMQGRVGSRRIIAVENPST